VKYGLRLPSFALGEKTAKLEEMGVYLRRAEELGFESAFTIDHLLITPPAYSGTWLEPLTFLAALAGVTRKIKLGTLILALPLRNPVLLAKEWATLDLLTGGRTIFGVGVGWHEGEFSLMNVPYKERGARMTEMLEIMRALWSTDKVTYHGKHYNFQELTIEPKPLQRPSPPIWMGGGTQPSEKFYGQTVKTVEPVLKRIARFADAWVPHASATPEMARNDWARIGELAREVGRDPNSLGNVYTNYIWVLAPGEKPVSATPHFGSFSGMDFDYWMTYYLLGDAELIAQRAHERIAALDYCVNQIVFNPVSWSLEQLERIAADVIPRIETLLKGHTKKVAL
jgi:probable F420-dependent oxidoreductase